MQHPDLAKTVTSQPAPFTPSERSESPTTPNPASRPILLELERQEKNPLDIDWITIALGLLALIAVGGLVPFFLWVYFAFNPPIP
jgi:hypothetical protein